MGPETSAKSVWSCFDCWLFGQRIGSLSKYFIQVLSSIVIFQVYKYCHFPSIQVLSLSKYFIQVLSFVTLVHIKQIANQDWSKVRTAFTKQLQNFPVSANLPKFDVKIIAAKDNRRVQKITKNVALKKTRAWARSAMSNPRAACGPVKGFVRPSLGFSCSENILHTDNQFLFS